MALYALMYGRGFHFKMGDEGPLEQIVGQVNRTVQARSANHGSDSFDLAKMAWWIKYQEDGKTEEGLRLFDRVVNQMAHQWMSDTLVCVLRAYFPSFYTHPNVKPQWNALVTLWEASGSVTTLQMSDTTTPSSSVSITSPIPSCGLAAGTDQNLLSKKPIDQVALYPWKDLMRTLTCSDLVEPVFLVGTTEDLCHLLDQHKTLSYTKASLQKTLQEKNADIYTLDD